MEEEKQKESPSSLSKINFFLALALAAAIALVVNWLQEELNSENIDMIFLQEQVKELETKNNELAEELSKLKEGVSNIQYEYFLEKLSNVIDFSVPSIQTVGDGFMLSRAEQEAHLTGIKFRGRILNTQSIQHKNITFKLTVNKIEKTFTINQISAGNSTSFEVYVPDLSAEDARYGSIKYVESTVVYYTK